MSHLLPEVEILLDISNEIFRLKDCTELAHHLQVDNGVVIALEEETRDPNEIAFHVLKEWSRKENANKRVLYEALSKKPFEHLARKYKDDLLPTDGPQTKIMITHQLSVPHMTDGTKAISAQPTPEKLPLEVLMELSSLIGSKTECVRLAAMLGFDGPDIIRWSSSMKSIANVAEEIFLSWNANTAAPRNKMQSILGKALLEIRRRDLYDIFTRKCDSLSGQLNTRK